MRRLALFALLAALLTPALLTPVFAAKVADVRATKHNFSATATGRTTGTAPTRNVTASSETQVCVFCHTPHGATAEPRAPLWNRQLSGQTYTPYTSSSLDANVLQGVLDQPNGSSKLCLSCHDGTLAIGNVNVLSGQTSPTISMTGTEADGSMPGGSGATTGFTRKLGIDLTNDHPISVTFTSALADRDGELRPVDANQQWPADGSVLGVRGSGYKPQLPLEPTASDGKGQVQCASCHDPHMYDEQESTKGAQKFLRQNRFQEAAPGDTHDPTNDIICLSCHDKNKGYGSWAFSAHANPTVADETYKATPAAQREFPNAQPVWKAACLNCHDTHTVQGSRRLLREGTDSAVSPKTGGNPALEETCFQCHSNSAASVVTAANGTVPDIKTDFGLARHMPIRSSEQAAGAERHDISANFSDAGFIDCTGATSACGKDFVEPRSRLGVGDNNNRHAECTDCHNPHRIIRAANGLPGQLNGTNTSTATRATHNHAAGHTNVISGALRGTWGVEPQYGDGSFFSLPTGYDVKRGDPGANTSTLAASSYVTREYQICLKCHSDYGYTDDNVLPSGTSRPSLGSPGTPSPRTNFDRYTNQAREFQPNNSSGATGAGGTYGTDADNHRSWHPVVAATGRTTAVRGGLNASNWRSPFNSNIGSQTMYCTDCHGSNTPAGDSSPGTNPWGPHGSTNDFILKGTWNTSSGTGQSNALCFKCHNEGIYTGNSPARTGFWIFNDRSKDNDGHKVHRDKINNNVMRCNWCHVAVPHGWKNKALLINLNDAGPEVGLAAGTKIQNSSLPYTNGPYYRNAMNKIKDFRPSGQWEISACGDSSQDSRSWMQNTCKSPP